MKYSALDLYKPKDVIIIRGNDTFSAAEKMKIAASSKKDNIKNWGLHCNNFLCSYYPPVYGSDICACCHECERSI